MSEFNSRYAAKALSLGLALMTGAFAAPVLAQQAPVVAPASATSMTKAVTKPQINAESFSAASHKAVTPEMLKAAGEKIAVYQALAAAPNLPTTQPGTITSPTNTAGLPAPQNLNPLARASLAVSKDLFATAPMVAAAAATTGAPVPTSCPNTYEAASAKAAEVLAPAYQAYVAENWTAIQAQLPTLDAALNAVPLKAIAPEICNDHVNVYTNNEYARLNMLSDAGFANGMPKNLPLVKQPDLPLVTLAYVVGISKTHFKDYDGAFLAFAKGLILDPYDSDLAQQYVSTLFELGRFTDAVGFTETFLTKTHTLDDTERSGMFAAHGFALLVLGYLDLAEQSFVLALYYNPGDESLIDVILKIREARAKAPAKS
jgi:tetratricopeptide (TPR) repeat protein